MVDNKIILVLGGTRSGKSNFALQLAQKLSQKVAFIATYNPEIDDPEMQARIKAHQQARPQYWQTIEEAIDPWPHILNLKPEVVLLDCLTLLISNLLISSQNYCLIIERIKELIKKIKEAGITAIIVSNELGHSLISTNRLGREFVDLTGQANQVVAQEADEVYFLIAGLPLKIK